MPDTGYIIHEDTGDRYEWRECESDDDCIVLVRQLLCDGGGFSRSRELHVPRLVLEAIAEQVKKAEAR